MRRKSGVASLATVTVIVGILALLAVFASLPQSYVSLRVIGPTGKLLTNQTIGEVTYFYYTENETDFPSATSLENVSVVADGVVLKTDSFSLPWDTDDDWNTNGTHYGTNASEGDLVLNRTIPGEYTLDANTVALYHMNNVTGKDNETNVYDETNTNNGTKATDGPVWNCTSDGYKFGGCALSFDGVDDYVNISDDTSLDSSAVMTLELWMYHNGAWDSDGGIIENGENTPYMQYAFFVNSGNLIWVQSNGGWETWVQATPPSNNVWHHIVGTNDGSTARLYIDGVEVGTDTSPATSLFESTDPLKIGYAYVGGSVRWFNGIIDEVAIYNRSLSADEIAAHYLGNFLASGSYSSNTITTTNPITNVTATWHTTEQDENKNISINISTDDGETWSLAVNDSVIDTNGSVDNTRLKFIAFLNSNDTTQTPQLHQITLDYYTQPTNGAILSQTHNAQFIADWDVVNWTTDEPLSTSIILETQTSNDGSSWNSLIAQTNNTEITSENAQYIRYKATSSTTNVSNTPKLLEVNLSYKALNISESVGFSTIEEQTGGNITFTYANGTTAPLTFLDSSENYTINFSKGEISAEFVNFTAGNLNFSSSFNGTTNKSDLPAESDIDSFLSDLGMTSQDFVWIDSENFLPAGSYIAKITLPSTYSIVYNCTGTRSSLSCNEISDVCSDPITPPCYKVVDGKTELYLNSFSGGGGAQGGGGDTQAPVVTLISPADTSWTANSQPDFTFNATDDVDLSMYCELFIGDIGYGVNDSVLNATDTTIAANDSLGEGAHTWYVNCTDDALNTGQSPSWTINIDLTAPASADNATSAWQNTNMTVNVSSTDSGSGLSAIIYCTNTTLVDCTPDIIDSKTDLWNFTLVEVGCDSDSVCNEYVKYQANDTLNNLEPVESSVQINIDKEKPTTTDDSTSDWQSSDITVTLTPNDGSGSEIADTLYCIDTDGAPDCTPDTSGTSALITCADGTVCTGNYVLYYSVDNVGNTEDVKTSNEVRIDKEAPTATIDSPSNYSNWSYAPTLDGTCEDNGVGRDSIWTNASEYSDILTSSPFNFTNTSDLAEGLYDIKISCNDSLNNTLDPEVIFTFDATPPSVVFLDLTPQSQVYLSPGGTIYASGSINVNVSAQDALSGISTVQFILGSPFSMSRYEGDMYDGNWTYLLDTVGYTKNPYTLRANATDFANNYNDTETLSVTFDNVGPIGNITNIISNYTSGGGQVFVNSLIDVNFTQTDSESGVSKTNLYIQDISGSILNVYDNDTDTGFTVDTTPFSDGTYYLVLNATDNVGNTNSSMDNKTIIIDNTPQNGSITNIYPNSTNASGSVFIKGDGKGNVFVKFIVSDSGSGVKYTNLTIVNSSGIVTIMVNASNTFVINTRTANQYGSVPLQDGAYDLILNSSDNVGNVNNSDDIKTVTVDTTRPSYVEFVSPTDVDYANVSRDWTYVNATSSDATSPIDSCWLEWNGANYSMALTQMDSEVYCELNQSSQPDGIYTYKVWANDSADNQNTSATRTITLDTTPPNVATTADGYQYWPYGWVNYDVSAGVGCDDGSGSGCNDSTYRLLSYSSDPGSCPADYESYVSGYDSPYSVSAHSWWCSAAKDFADPNGTSPVQLEFLVDEIPPTITINPTTYPPHQTWAKYYDPVLLNVSASDLGDSGIAYVYFDGSAVGYWGDYMSFDGNNWIYLMPIYISSDYEDAPIYVQVGDNAGNYVEDYIYVDVDNTAPSIEIQSPDASSWQGSDGFSVNVSESDALSGLNYCKYDIRTYTESGSRRILSDDFETYEVWRNATAWSIVNPDSPTDTIIVANDNYFSGSYSLRVSDWNSDPDSEDYATLTAPVGYNETETQFWYYRSYSYNGYPMSFKLMGDGTEAVELSHYSDDALYYYNGISPALLGYYGADQWLRVRLIANASTDKFDLFLYDGSSYLVGSASNVDLKNPVDSFNAIRITAPAGTETGITWYDLITSSFVKPCDSTPTITVGPTSECYNLGADSCLINAIVIDNAGNANSNYRYFSIDYVAPTIDDNYTASEIWMNDSRTIALYPNDAGGSGLKNVSYCEGAGCTPDTLLISPYEKTYTGTDVIFRYQAWDNADNPSFIKEKSIKIDSVAPTVDSVIVTSPTRLPSQTITGTFTEANLDEITVNGVLADISADTYSATIPLLEGSNTINVVAKDLAGNQGSDSSQIIVLDTQAPAITIDVVTPTNETTQNVSGTYSDGTGIANITVNGINATLDGGVYNATVSLPREGANLITVIATDNVGNKITDTAIITRDTVLPVITIVSPTAVITPILTQNLTGTIYDSSGIVSANYTHLDANGAEERSGPLTTPNFGPILLYLSARSNGNNTIRISAIDAAGNFVQVEKYVTYDPDAPLVTIIPKPENLTSTAAQYINGTINDLSIIRATLTFNGADRTINVVDGQFNESVSLLEGNNFIQVSATDSAGNKGADAWTIELDTIPPILIIDPVTTPTNVGTQEITGLVYDKNLDPTNVLVNGDTATVVGTTYSYTYTLSDGDNPITVVATDLVGNSVSKSTSIFYDPYAPAVYDDYGYNGIWVNWDQTITITADDTAGPSSGVKEILYCYGWGCTPTLVSRGSTLTLSFTTDQDTLVRYQAFDNVDNPSSTGEFNVMIDKTVPTTTSSFTSTEWQTNDIYIELSCNDAPSGCTDETVFCIDDSNSCDPYDDGEYYWDYGPFWLISDYGLGDGIWYLRYNSYDNAGNNENIKSQIVKMDRVAPTLMSPSEPSYEIIYPSGQTEAKEGQTITINTMVSDGTSGLKNVTVDCSRIGSGSAILMSPTVTPNGDSVYTAQCTLVGTSGIEDSRQIVVSAYDNAANLNYYVTYVNIDNVPPAAISDLLVADTPYDTDGTVSLTWGTPAPDAVDYNIYRSQSSGFTPLPSNLIKTTTSTTETDTPNTDGTYYWKIIAVDNVGNIGPESNEVSTFIDTGAPSITDLRVAYPNGQTQANAYDYVTVEAEVTDPEGVSEVWATRTWDSGSLYLGDTEGDSLYGSDDIVSFSATTSEDGRYATFNVQFYNSDPNAEETVWADGGLFILGIGLNDIGYGTADYCDWIPYASCYRTINLADYGYLAQLNIMAVAQDIYTYEIYDAAPDEGYTTFNPKQVFPLYDQGNFYYLGSVPIQAFDFGVYDDASISVFARDTAGNVRGPVDVLTLIDGYAPDSGSAWIDDGADYTSTTNQLKAKWYYPDWDSGVKYYQYYIYSSSGWSSDWNSINYSDTIDSWGQPKWIIAQTPTLEEGATYYWQIYAVDNAGNWDWNGIQSNGVTVDTTPPEFISLTDDGNFSGSACVQSASWSAQDLESGISRYFYRVGVDSNLDNRIEYYLAPGWQNTGSGEGGPVSSVTHNACDWGQSFDDNYKYFFEVKTENNAGVSTFARTDGMMADLNPPTASLTFARASWTKNSTLTLDVSCSDTLSGIASCETEYAYDLAPDNWYFITAEQGTTQFDMSAAAGDGIYKFRTTAVDAVGNRYTVLGTDIATGEDWAGYDSTAPNTTITVNPSEALANWTNLPINATLSAEDLNPGREESGGFQWIECLNNNPDVVDTGDDSDFEFNMPFTFPYFGRDIVSIDVDSNGEIELLESWESCYNCNGYGTHYYGEYYDSIFALNDDLEMDPYDIGGDAEYGLCNLDDKIVVQWSGTTYNDYSNGYDRSSNPIDFEVIIYQNGNVRWQFLTLDYSSYYYDLFSGLGVDSGNDIVLSYAQSEANTAYQWTSGSENINQLQMAAASGVESINYRVDGADYSIYEGEFNITSAGKHKIDYYSADVAGNIETLRTAYIYATDDAIVENTNVTDSNVTNSTLENSQVTGSNTTGSTIANSTLILTNSENSNVSTSTVSNSNIINSTVTNSAVDPSTIINSNVSDSIITNSQIADSNVSDSVITSSIINNSNIKNSYLITSMTIRNANVTNNIIYSGTLICSVGTFNIPPTAPANVKTLCTPPTPAAPTGAGGAVAGGAAAPELIEIIKTSVDPSLALAKVTVSSYAAATINVEKVSADEASSLVKKLDDIGRTAYLDLMRITVSESIENAKIEFKVLKSWLSDNNYDSAAVALYRYDTSWNSVTTTQVSEDATYIYYSATLPKLSIFAVTVEKAKAIPTCPACPKAKDWSYCVNNVQTRTNYRCDSSTNYKCEAYTEQQTCIPPLPTPIALPISILALIAVAVAMPLAVFYSRRKAPRIALPRIRFAIPKPKAVAPPKIIEKGRPPLKELKMYICPRCGATFSSKRGLQIHERKEIKRRK